MWSVSVCIISAAKNVNEKKKTQTSELKTHIRWVHATVFQWTWAWHESKCTHIIYNTHASTFAGAHESTLNLLRTMILIEWVCILCSCRVILFLIVCFSISKNQKKKNIAKNQESCGTSKNTNRLTIDRQDRWLKSHKFE